jgi:hypothetical protein
MAFRFRFVGVSRPSLPSRQKESAFIFNITLPPCAFTVISLIPSLKPICLFNKQGVVVQDF